MSEEMAPAGAGDSEAEKRRRINRDAAARSRRKQKEMVDSLKKKNLDLESEKTKLTYDNMQLQKKLQRFSEICKDHAMICPTLREELLLMTSAVKPDSGVKQAAGGCSTEVAAYPTHHHHVTYTTEADIVEGEPQQGEAVVHYIAIEDDRQQNNCEVETSVVPEIMEDRAQLPCVPACSTHSNVPLASRAHKRGGAAQSEERSKVARTDAPPVRHFAKARKAQGVSPLVNNAAAVSINSSNVHVTMFPQHDHAVSEAEGKQSEEEPTSEACDDGNTPSPSEASQSPSPVPGPQCEQAEQQVVPPDLPAMLQDYHDDQDNNAPMPNAAPNSARKITHEGHKSYQSL